MFGYSLSLATAGNIATNGSANTETDVIFIKPGASRAVGLVAFDCIGKGAALTTLSGISFRMARLATASTAGTGITPAPKDNDNPAAACTAASAPTIGTTRTNRWIVGCGATGPGGWWAKTQQMIEKLEASYAGSYDIISASGTVSLNFEASCEIVEW